MTKIKLSGSITPVRADQPYNVEKNITECKSKFNEILTYVLDTRQEAHEMEAGIFNRLLELGLCLLKLFFASYNYGDFGENSDSLQGTAKRGKKSDRTYFSIFGKIKVTRYLYHVSGNTFAPLDILLNLPKRCYSYFLSEMLNTLNIKDAYSEGVSFIQKFFSITVSVSASETVSGESSTAYENFYEDKAAIAKHQDYTIVSFDGKGVPMIKEEAAKIIGRPGKGQKKQKKKKRRRE